MEKFRFLFVLFMVSAWYTQAHADTPLLPIQGRLLDVAGQPIDGSRSVTFAIYQAPTGGGALYEETQAIGFADGHFVAYLGDVLPLDPTLFDGASRLWLGITIQGDAEMQPRFRLGSASTAAYSQMCGDAATVGGSSPSNFAPRAHTHVAWVDADGVEVREALPWPPVPDLLAAGGDFRAIRVQDDTGLIWGLDVFTGDVGSYSYSRLWYTTTDCSGQPYKFFSDYQILPPRFVFRVSQDPGQFLNMSLMFAVIPDTLAPMPVQANSFLADGSCVARLGLSNAAVPATIVGAAPAFPYQFPLHPEFHGP
jgi:hypothetical protein